MDNILINGKLQMSLPDGFHVMDEEERSGLRVLMSGPFIAFTDPQRHIIATVGWKNAGIASLILRASDIASGSEKQIAKGMQKYAYVSEGFSERNVGGTGASGFGYRYTPDEGIGMYGETHVLKKGRTVYFFNVYVRDELREESIRVWDDILGSAVWK